MSLLLSILIWLFAALHGAVHDPAIDAVAQPRAELAEWRHNLDGYPQSCGVGEVIARGVTDPYQAIQAWHDSFWHQWVIDQSWDRIGGGEHDGYVIIVFLKDC